MGAFDVVPPLIPKLTVAVAAMFLVNAPVPVKVKLVAVAIDSTVVDAVVLVRAMLLDPNEMDRAVLLEESKTPTLKLNPLRLRVPLDNVNVRDVPSVKLSSIVKVPTPVFETGKLNVFPFDVTFCVVEDAKDVEREVELRDIPDDIVRSPYIVVATLGERVPLKPVKFKFLKLADVEREIVSDPPVT